jgi:hypothetical protein
METFRVLFCLPCGGRPSVRFAVAVGGVAQSRPLIFPLMSSLHRGIYFMIPANDAPRGPPIPLQIGRHG